MLPTVCTLCGTSKSWLERSSVNVQPSQPKSKKLFTDTKRWGKQRSPSLAGSILKSYLLKILGLRSPPHRSTCLRIGQSSTLTSGGHFASGVAGFWLRQENESHLLKLQKGKLIKKSKATPPAWCTVEIAVLAQSDGLAIPTLCWPCLP